MKIKVPRTDGTISVYTYDNDGKMINHEIIQKNES